MASSYSRTTYIHVARNADPVTAAAFRTSSATPVKSASRRGPADPAVGLSLLARPRKPGSVPAIAEFTQSSAYV
eukprot:scaffold15083_cov66-Phaeocystis_antarctica.AAC.6